jgi:hypothetical protein
VKIDVTKIANLILYMIEKKVNHLNDKKLAILLFLIDFEHKESCNETIFGEEYIKTKRGPQPLLVSEIFDIIKNDEDLDEDDERLFIIQELLDYIDIDIFKKDGFIELKFIALEEFDDDVFTSKEFKTIDAILTKYQDTTPRNCANACFKIDLVRSTDLLEVIL